ncbi:MAG: putative toxin-antitoxin system toxin component, PIN family [Comamonadaceae bacterium CG12_big_fil_rev_8_21_14_0_65_59_15]|nr:MAG: putative toxin-antitoxin system toxin component, PIN family [Comamonadaceae bacterium CG12_big_fil_rev_8_21_14_0_65_59_15]
MPTLPLLRVVLDTNVWLSAALSPQGAPAQVVQRVLLQGVAVFSDATFAELQTRLWKPKFDRYLSLDVRHAILRDARAAALWVDIAPDLATQHWSRDADDDAFIRTALAAQASWLVSGDDDLLSLPSITGLTILSPTHALLRWAKAD